MNILLVEHILFYGDMIRASLFRRGHTCFLAENAVDALSYISVLQFDCVVVDILIPGSATLEEILYACQVYNSPIVMVSDDATIKAQYSNYNVIGVIPRESLFNYSFMDNFITGLENNVYGGKLNVGST